MNILEPNLLILASAGSGKTFQLANRVIGLVAGGVAPEKIVALTFTRKAAGEFADSVLMKLATSASQPAAAAELRRDLMLPNADFSESLEQVVRALPRLTFGTMDSFFAKVVRGFQYELGLTGGKFELLEGPRASTATDEILASILAENVESPTEDHFLQAFRRASFGKEEQGVLDGLRSFVQRWQSRYRVTDDLAWGPSALAGVHLDDWEPRRHALVAQVRRGLDCIEYTRKGQREALEKVLDSLLQHAIGSGSLGSATGLLGNLLAVASSNPGPLTLKYYKEFLIGGPAGDALRELVNLAARCEMAAALLRTRAVREVISVYDARCEKQLRHRGLLGFEDVKMLMAEWANDEHGRLRREAVDFRLDARYDHWLLDEFQDTSRADWLGLQPLIDEAAGEGQGTMFIVGDRKQAIYAWRGGEVGLFDQVTERYRSSGLEIAEMAESWRSCPEVLALVNQVCGDTATMHEFFGKAESQWQWQAHFAAARLQNPAQRGEARVEVVAGKWEERLERLASLFVELGVGERQMSCGVLVRSNIQVRKIADDLRARGFEVIEEGRREPAKDNPIGITLAHLLKWLANPADAFAREVVEMSPLAPVLRAKFGDHWQQVWEGLSGLASNSGFAGMVEELIESSWLDWSDFGRRRAGDVLMALAGLDAQGGVTPQQAAEWIARLEVAQSPGIAAVQVMTIHKSKGLGFDVVVLPDIPNDSIPSAQYFEVAEGDGWISQTPPKWARELIPEMREAEANWATGQRYEGFCMLYVALTRAKRGLYVLLEPPASSQEVAKPSLANWLAQSVSSNGQPGLVYQSGSIDWVETLPCTRRQKESPALPTLVASVTRRERVMPSAAKKIAAVQVTHFASGMPFGSEVHAAFEQVGWVDECSPDLPSSEAGGLVAELLEIPSLRQHFTRHGERIELFREQAVDAVLAGQWLSGIIDRLHLYRDAAGKVNRVQVIDFKTDGVAEVSELVDRYAAQMSGYRDVMASAYPAAQIECLLLSTWLRAWVVL